MRAVALMRAVVLLVAVLLLGFGVARISSGSDGFSVQEKPSVVEEGAMTERQKEHSKLYKEYRTGRKLRDIRVRGMNDVNVGVGIGLPMGDPSAPPFDLHRFLRTTACGADAVVIGVVKAKASQFTEDEDFVFTDYDIVVREVLKDNSSNPIQLVDTITVTRPGGAVELNGRVYRATDPSFQPFVLDGRYILFLRHIAKTGGYKAVDSKGAFQLLSNKVEKLTSEWTGLETESDTTRFLDDVRGAITSGCDKRREDR